MSPTEAPAVSLVPERAIPVPGHLSPIAQATLTTPPLPFGRTYPAPDDAAGWREYAVQMDAVVTAMFAGRDELPVAAEPVDLGGVRAYALTPPGLDATSRKAVLNFHGGALVMGGGEVCRIMGAATALRLQARVFAVDYRMPPDHPYPAALDDAVAAYRALLADRAAQDIVVEGGSAGGNLAAALVLRARDEGLPLPAGVILGTPEADLTESGDSFHTNLGVDATLGLLMPVNRLYAGGHDLAHPYLSPLFGDFARGFPPTILSTGTRDLFLSNTVRMHRALRAAEVPAELHVIEAGGHIGFPGAPEGEAIDRELRGFLARVWA